MRPKLGKGKKKGSVTVEFFSAFLVYLAIIILILYGFSSLLSGSVSIRKLSFSSSEVQELMDAADTASINTCYAYSSARGVPPVFVNGGKAYVEVNKVLRQVYITGERGNGGCI